MHDQQRVGRAQPQRADFRHPAASRQSRCGPDDQADAEQDHQPMTQHRGDDVLTGQRGNAAAHPQEQRPVGRRGLPPQAGHRQREDVAEAQAGRRAHPVRVEAQPADPALRQVGVDVLAEHRGRDQQRQHPQQQRAVQVAPRHPSLAQREPAQHQPGQGHHHRAGGGHRQRYRLDPRREVEQPYPERRVLDHRPGSGAECADGHQDSAGSAEHPSASKRGLLGVVQGLAHRLLVAVQAGDRRTQRVVAVCHHSSVAAIASAAEPGAAGRRHVPSRPRGPAELVRCDQRNRGRG